MEPQLNSNYESMIYSVSREKNRRFSVHATLPLSSNASTAITHLRAFVATAEIIAVQPVLRSIPAPMMRVAPIC